MKGESLWIHTMGATPLGQAGLPVGTKACSLITDGNPLVKTDGTILSV